MTHPASSRRHGYESDGAAQGIQGAVQQDLALGQVVPRLTLRTEHEVVVTVLVDFQPHHLTVVDKLVVQLDREAEQRVIGADLQENRGLIDFPRPMT